MKTYLCPKCGSFMYAISTASIPPQARYVCSNCTYASKTVEEENWAVPLPDELRSDMTTVGEVFKKFLKCRILEISDYRPIEDMYTESIKDKAGIIVWFENGDTMLYYPKGE